VKVAPPVIKVISEKEIRRREWRESVEKIAMNHKGEWIKGYYISKEGVLYEGTLLGMEQVERERKLEKSGSEEIFIGEGEWLKLCENPSNSVGGRIVSIPSAASPNKWAMKEDRSSINRYAPKELVVNIGTNGEMIDDNGRYWVAVGPNIMNPDHDITKKVTAEEMKYGTEIDIIIKDKNENEYYIYAVVGDVKNHTYPSGIYQTGNAFPNGTDTHPNNADGSIIEFMGKGSIIGLHEYEIVEIIVYD